MNLFGVIPAAGASRRMGADKLLLPWGDRTLIERAVDLWFAAGATQTVAVIPSANREAIGRAGDAGAVVVTVDRPPPEMKNSVQIALDAIEKRFAPPDDDLWGLSPVDLPTWSPAVAKRLVATATGSEAEVFVPRFGERRGHPALFRMRLAEAVRRLPPGRGVDFLLESRLVAEVSCSADEYASDVDDPASYARLRREWDARSEPSDDPG